MQQKGFTLVELVIVFSIIALLSIAGLASFSAFSQRQLLTNSISDLRTILNVARTRTVSQVNGVSPNSCSAAEQFSGYAVIVCCKGGSGIVQSNCPSIAACVGSDDYDLFIACTAGTSTFYRPVQGGKFSSGVVVSAATTARTFQFAPISGTVTFGTGGPVSSGMVTLSSSSQNVSTSVTVTSIGAIQ